MQLIVVTGLSGSGKSIALDTLEDGGAYCVDNLPISLLGPFAKLLAQGGLESFPRAAVGIDARTDVQGMRAFPRLVEQLVEQGLEVRILFLQAATEILLKRFSETRRKHPLSGADISLAEAIQQERELLQPLLACADVTVDTTHTNLYELRDLVRQRLTLEIPRLSLMFLSFGFKRGVPQDADFIFDVRCLPNPHWEPNLRVQTGKDGAVATFLEGHPSVHAMFEELRGFVERWIPAFEDSNRAYLTVAIGCTGGQHRSVYLSERLAAYFSAQRQNVLLRHRELGG